MTPDEAVQYLLGIPRFAHAGGEAYKPGLERVHRLLGEMGDPHHRFRIVHIAGTNGKGSTASLIASVGTSLGFRTGLHTSPHLFDLSERMRVDGVPASGDWLAAAVSEHRSLFERSEASFFEATMALSLRYFAEREVDWAVVEVGLGGRLDATNVLDPAATVVTRIGLDHQEFLGPDIESIAREKAGIFKPGVPVFASVTDPEAVAVLESVARDRGSPLSLLERDFSVSLLEDSLTEIAISISTAMGLDSRFVVGLPGVHQAENAAVAAATAECVWGDRAGFMRGLEQGLRHVRVLSGLRGRCEVLHEEPLIVADVAHNPDGLKAALTFMRGRGSGPPAGVLVVAMGIMRDKPAAEMANLLGASDVNRVFSLRVESPRALPADQFCSIVRGAGIACEIVDGASEAKGRFEAFASERDGLLIVGSHMVVEQLAEFLTGPR